jgi:hypothetical protein
MRGRPRLSTICFNSEPLAPPFPDYFFAKEIASAFDKISN